MKKTLMTSFLLLVCSLALMAAQSETDQQNMPSSSEAGRKIKISGCLQSGSEPNSYVLNNATPSGMSQPSSQDSGQSRSQADMGMDPSELARTQTSYTLVPEGNVNLENMVGKKVEVTGKMIQSDYGSSATDPSGRTSPSHSSTEMSGEPKFQVSSIRQIGQSCR